MRGPSGVLLAFSFASILLSNASAQTALTAGRGSDGPAASAPISASATTAPAPCGCSSDAAPQHVQGYTAKQETTRISPPLADGSAAKTVEEVYLARDAEGRTRNESIRIQDGQVIHSFAIWDYVTQTRYVWSVGAHDPRTVMVYRRRQDRQPVAPAPPSTPPAAPRYYPRSSETLPPKTIDGLYVEGSLSKRTIPAGYEGNDRDIVTTTESWYIPSLSLPLRLVVDDPRSGETITETTDIQQTDPDPSLFRPPADYQLKEGNP